MRGGSRRTRSLTFGASDLEIDVDVQRRASAASSCSASSPRAASATVEVQRDDGSIAATAETDDLGRFRLELDEGGRVRLLVRRDPPAALVETSWLTL